VDIESSRIDFALVDDAATGKSTARASAPGKASSKPQATVTRPASAGKGKKSGGKSR
jgi:hypothetical protein